MMALLESRTVWHENDRELIKILPFASHAIKLRHEESRRKCKWSIETTPNALQVIRKFHFFVREFKILWTYPQQMKRNKEEKEEIKILFHNRASECQNSLVCNLL